jgi:hypothetical protein
MTWWGRSTLLALGMLGLASLAWLVEQHQSTSAPAGSIDRHGGNGLALALAYLQSRGTDAAPSHRPLAPGTVPANAIVLRLTATHAKTDNDLSASERQWITGGGRLVMAEAGEHDETGSIDTAVRIWPDVQHLEPLKPTTLIKKSGAVIMRRGNGALITWERIGAGDLIRLTCGDCLTDERLDRSDHLALLHGLTDFGSNRPVRFDEFALGRGGFGLGEILRRLGLIPAAMLVLLTTAVWAWRRTIVTGPVDAPPPERREDAIELVDSLGELLGEHLDDNALLAAYEERLRTIVSRRLGVHGSELTAFVTSLLGPALPTETAFQQRLHRLNSAFERALHERLG